MSNIASMTDITWPNIYEVNKLNEYNFDTVNFENDLSINYKFVKHYFQEFINIKFISIEENINLSTFFDELVEETNYCERILFHLKKSIQKIHDDIINNFINDIEILHIQITIINEISQYLIDSKNIIVPYAEKIVEIPKQIIISELELITQLEENIKHYTEITHIIQKLIKHAKNITNGTINTEYYQLIRLNPENSDFIVQNYIIKNKFSDLILKTEELLNNTNMSSFNTILNFPNSSLEIIIKYQNLIKDLHITVMNYFDITNVGLNLSHQKDVTELKENLTNMYNKIQNISKEIFKKIAYTEQIPEHCNTIKLSKEIQEIKVVIFESKILINDIENRLNFLIKTYELTYIKPKNTCNIM